MMYKKAILFHDAYYADQILNSRNAKSIKEYGRKIRGFQPDIWNQKKLDIVTQGNYLKFSQNDLLKEYLLGTGGKILVEASPYDSIWGIGMRASAKGVEDPKNWKGQNPLGKALMEARKRIREEED